MKFVKYGICVLFFFVLTLKIVPAYAQETEEETLRDLGMMGTYALGDLALTDIRKQNDPLLQLKRFFIQVNLPLSSAEERQLGSEVDRAVKALRAAKDDTTVRRANATFNKNMFAVLSPDQQTALKRYINEQIMMRGGFAALKLILDDAKTPLTEDQQAQIEPLYRQFNQQADALTRESNGAPDKEKLDNLQSQTLGNVVKVLTPIQRRSLAASRLRGLSSRGKAPK